ncbi:MAG: hypothetical protein IJQ67_00800 [Bacilli bacterium]|nr:hypothetical protein [Methanobrevibacter sp.]MBR0294429.1 hypothetical protein [Bacilli bacterium]
MWIPYYIASIVIAIILIIKDWKDINEFLNDAMSSDEDKAFMIFMMIVFAPVLILIFIIVSCINLYFYVKNHHANKKMDINMQLNKLPKLMAEYDRLLRKPEASLQVSSKTSSGH